MNAIKSALALILLTASILGSNFASALGPKLHVGAVPGGPAYGAGRNYASHDYYLSPLNAPGVTIPKAMAEPNQGNREYCADAKAYSTPVKPCRQWEILPPQPRS